MGRIQPYIGTSISCLTSEDMTDKAYAGLLAVMRLIEVNGDGYIETTQTNWKRKKDLEVFLPVVSGIYIPGTVRNYWCGYFDTPVDFPPDNGCVIISNHDDLVQFEFVSVKRIRRFPNNTICQCKKPILFYKAIRTWVFRDNVEPPLIDITYFAIDKDGCVWTAFDKLKLRINGRENAWWIIQTESETGQHYGPGALSLLADRKYLWNVRTEEIVRRSQGGRNISAKVDFGINEEMVKSLLYARQNPRTESGRLRPILHWVRSHKRRLTDGIEIEIKKHLRGVTSFQMDGVSFEITEPKKEKDESGSLGCVGLKH